MNHEVIESLLGDYVDAMLTGVEERQVESHLEECAACRDEVAALRSLLAEAADLPRSIEPPRDLWPDIEARIDSSVTGIGLGGRTLWSMRYPLAAAAVLLIAVSSAITAILLHNRPAPVTTSLPPAALESPAAISLVSQWQAAEGEYLRAAAELVEALEAAKGTLSAQAVELIEYNLRIIDAAIRESRAALALDPTNRELMEMLSSTYQKKLDVLQQVGRLSAEL